MPVDTIEVKAEDAQPVWLSESDLSEWDDFVRGHPYGTVAHLSLWKQAIERSFSHIQGRVCALRDPISGAIRAGVPVYIVRSWLLGTRLVSVPHATLCDPLVSRGGDWERLHVAVMELRSQTGAKNFQVKPRVASPLCSWKGYGESPYKHHYLNLERPLADIRKGFARKGVHYMISKAAKAQVRVERQDSESAIRAFHRMFASARRELCLPSVPGSFFSNLLRCLGNEHASLFIAYQDQRPVAGLLETMFRDRMEIEYACGTPASRRTGALQLAYWEAIKEAHAKGCKQCSFGRTSPDNAGLLAHKRRWGTVEETVRVYTYPGRSETDGSLESSWLARLMKLAVRAAPLRGYELLSRFCYRHWA